MRRSRRRGPGCGCFSGYGAGCKIDWCRVTNGDCKSVSPATVKKVLKGAFPVYVTTICKHGDARIVAGGKRFYGRRV